MHARWNFKKRTLYPDLPVKASAIPLGYLALL